MRPVTNPKSETVFSSIIQSKVRELVWNADIDIDDVRISMLNWEARFIYKDPKPDLKAQLLIG